MPGSAVVAESGHHDDENNDYLQNREEQLELSGAFHANPVDERNQNNGGDSEKLSVADRERPPRIAGFDRRFVKIKTLFCPIVRDG